MRLTAWSTVRPLTGVSSMRVIRSPDFRPARKAGRAFDRRDHLDQAVFHAHLDADADELAADAFAEFLVALLVEVLRMRVQPGDHAGDGVVDELLLVDRLDVFGLDDVEHGG
jgi:hypothetical protein